MAWKQPLQWFRSLVFRSRAEADLDDELKFHLAMTERKLAARGSAPAEAHHQAAVLFGATEAVKEQCRDVRGTRWLEDLLQDCSFALRLSANENGPP